MAIKNPPHPGRILRQECLEALGLSVTSAAEHLGVTRQALNNVVNERAAISPEMAIRIAKAFGSRPELWLGLQVDYDLAQAQKAMNRVSIQRVRRKTPKPVRAPLQRGS